MGGTGSTRRLVVEQIDGAGVVKVSESVVQRLRASGDSERSNSERVPPYQARQEPVCQPTVTDGRINSKEAIQEIEQFYQRQLKDLEHRNANMQKITNEQFATAVQEVEHKFMRQVASPVCQNLQSRIYQCYIDNATRTLNCSKEVRAFTSCVEKARQNALTRKG